MAISSNSDVQVTDNNLLLYPRDQEITETDLQAMISQNEDWAQNYEDNREMYIGQHSILSAAKKIFGPDNRLVVNMPHYIVDTFNGYFMGNPPKITLPDKGQNESLQDWNDTNSLQDRLNEVSKQADLYGRSYLFFYQNEDAGTKVAVVSPLKAFMVYDDTVTQQPLAFVTYAKDRKGKSQWVGTIYYATKQVTFNDYLQEETPNPYGLVPAVEFFDNAERQGVFDNVKTLCHSLDKVLSQKANQVEYFDNAYLKILGLNLDQDGDGKPDIDISQNHMIYSPDAEAANAVVDFISKPDGDTMQENMLNRLMDLIYQTSQVVNLNDKEFSGNSSGVALKYKMLPMQNMAANKERKFRQSLRQCYKILFSLGRVAPEDAWSDLDFNFPRNMPANIEAEADTAQKLSGITSQETALSVLSIVDDPKEELKRKLQEQSDQAKNAPGWQFSATDQQVGGEEDGEGEE